ncbi:CHAT domain-containing protein [Limobrevibacterium gyesilva]|uniref:CHAT domain-containing protein n=1 Tax=Limobrevibacterium gyesilva TaxID=2991712 RepID=A0AA41YJX6_9PROT|nr:CHAT domain-containing protein [Limobrevibacterium gyesilva]MCW3474594.1 CHAT domain-containing protein [Limobrevibacterium gyesilva]
MRVAEIRVGALQYYVGAEHVHALLIDQDGRTQTFVLAAWDDVFPRIDRFMEKIERGSFSAAGAPAEFRAFSREWGRTLLPPAAALGRFDVLVILPHYVLHGLPFHTIWIEEEGQYLGTARGVTYCSSATLFTRCVDRNIARRSNLAEWAFALDGGGATGAPQAPRRCLGIGADILGGMTAEYRHVAEEFARGFAEPVTFPDATRAMIKNRLNRAEPWEALCIVCHGHYDDDISDNSGLLLDRDAMGITVRPIFLHRGRYFDFRDLPFTYLPSAIAPSRDGELMTVGELKVDCLTDAQLVALFGCSTGAGQVESGDDFNSMAYQWLKIGAASTLANLWEVDIAFLRRWSPVFLDNWLTRRQPKAIAWRQALRTVLDSDLQQDPYEWGAITLFGDWL